MLIIGFGVAEVLLSTLVFRCEYLRQPRCQRQLKLTSCGRAGSSQRRNADGSWRLAAPRRARPARGR